MTMGETTVMGGKAKERTEGEDVSMVTICQSESMLKGEMGLHEAARNGDNVTLERLLDQGFKVDARNNLDRTPLHWAAANGHLDTVRFLLGRDANVEAKDKYGMRALLWAAWFGRKAVFEFLLNDEYVKADPRATNKQGMTILHCVAQNNNADVLESLFEWVKNPDRLDMNRKEKNDRTPLHLAAISGSIEALRAMLIITEDAPTSFKEKKHEKLRQSRILNVSATEVLDRQGYHPVHLAVLENKAEFLVELLDQKITPPIDINVAAGPEKEGKSPLHFAAEKGHLLLTEKLLSYDGVAIDGRTTKRQTPLHLAVLHGKRDIVKLLLDYGADVDAEDYHKSTPLHLAAEANEARIIDILVARDANVNAFNVRHQLPLHIAVEAGLGLVAEVLIVAGASLEEKEKTGKSSLYLAARGGFVTLVDMIVKAERQHMLNQTKRCVETQTGETEDDVDDEDDDEDEVEENDGDGDEDDDDDITNKSLVDDGGGVILNDVIEDMHHRRQSAAGSHRSSVLVGQDVPLVVLTSSYDSQNGGVVKGVGVIGEGDPAASALSKKRRNKKIFRPSRAAEDAVCRHTGEKIPFRKGDSVHLPYMRDILWKLGAKQLKEQEWKRMAVYWNFSESQIRAIEHQYTGQFSYREHGYRMLLIWLDGVPREDNPIRCLYECLVAVGRRDLAEIIRKKINEMNPAIADSKTAKCSLM